MTLQFENVYIKSYFHCTLHFILLKLCKYIRNINDLIVYWHLYIDLFFNLTVNNTYNIVTLYNTSKDNYITLQLHY